MIYKILSIYFACGAAFGWFWFFKNVRRGAMAGDYLFWLILAIVWPFPFLTEVVWRVKR